MAEWKRSPDSVTNPIRLVQQLPPEREVLLGLRFCDALLPSSRLWPWITETAHFLTREGPTSFPSRKQISEAEAPLTSHSLPWTLPPS